MWNDIILVPSRKRTNKPRQVGVTMVMDTGLGMNQFSDLLSVCHDAIDFIKLGFGTVAVTPTDIVMGKIALARSHKVNVYPGGTFFEVAKAQGLEEKYFETLIEMNFKWVEISDGSIDMSLEERTKTIELAKLYGLKVITEIGKKEEGHITSFHDFLDTFYNDINCAVEYIIVESRESGKNIGAFDEEGNTSIEYVKRINDATNPRFLIWESPLKNQQVDMIKHFGSEINLGNISVHDALSVEA